MSVGLVIKCQDGETEARLVPIATERIFEEYWQPMCSALGLRWVPLFQSGLPLKSDDIPDVLDELLQLKAFLSNKPHPSIPEDMANHVVSRIKMLMRELQQIQEDPKAEGWIS